MYASLNPHLPALKSARAPQRAGAAIAIALHATVLAVVLSYEPARSALLAAAPIMVEWIAAATPSVTPPRKLPKPKPALEPAAQPAKSTPIIAAAKDQPAPAEAPAPPPLPAALAIVAAQVPVPVTQPIFAADYLDNPSPPYPPVSRRMREEGRVLLRVLVNPGGRADEVQVQSSSGFARLDGAARETVRQWKFFPAKRGADAVPAWVLIPVSFKLEG